MAPLNSPQGLRQETGRLKRTSRAASSSRRSFENTQSSPSPKEPSSPVSQKRKIKQGESPKRKGKPGNSSKQSFTLPSNDNLGIQKQSGSGKSGTRKPKVMTYPRARMNAPFDATHGTGSSSNSSGIRVSKYSREPVGGAGHSMRMTQGQGTLPTQFDKVSLENPKPKKTDVSSAGQTAWYLGILRYDAVVMKGSGTSLVD